MQSQIHKSATARIFSFIVLLGIIPAWFFYIGMKFKETMVVLDESQKTSQTIYTDLKTNHNE